MPNVLHADIVRAALAQMKPRPSVEMYPGDWLRDPISGCSLAANGFWWRAMMVMHDAKPYGHMVAANGKPLNDQQIVQRCGCRNTAEMKKVLAEVEGEGIPGRTGDAAYRDILRAQIEVRHVTWDIDLPPLAIVQTGVIYSRRMLRDRILSLVRFFVSPKGQALIPPLTPSLTTQNLDFDRVRAGDQKEDEGEKDSSAFDSEGVQGEDALRAALTAAGVRLAANQKGDLDEALRRFPLVWMLSLLAEPDVARSAAGKGFPYFRKILADRQEAGWQPRPKLAAVVVDPCRDQLCGDDVREIEDRVNDGWWPHASGATAEEGAAWLNEIRASYTEEHGGRSLLKAGAPTLAAWLKAKRKAS